MTRAPSKGAPSKPGTGKIATGKAAPAKAGAPRKAPSRPARDETEETTADRLDGFPHPREVAVVHGHEAAEATLRAAFDGGRMHHGWLLTGLDGIGKATLAYAFARYLLATPAQRAACPPGRLGVAMEAIAARQILAQSHPGLLVIRRTLDSRTKRISTQIRVDEVRRLRAFLQLTANDGAWRVVIVDPADDLNASSANALLKSLEEPPQRTLFLLLTAQPGSLLPTIQSRCRRLDLAGLAPHALLAATTQALEQAGGEQSLPEASDARLRLMALSQGSVRRLLQLSQAGGLDLYDRLLKLLGSLPDLDQGVLHALGEELGPAAALEKFEAFFGLLLDMLPRLVSAGATGRAILPEEAALAKRLMRPEWLASWAELWETIVRDKGTTMALNLDRRSLVLQTGFRMRDLAHAQR